MSYEKHTWISKEKITAQKLNNIESGIENNNNIVLFHATLSGTSVTPTESFSDMVEASQAKKLLFCEVKEPSQYDITYFYLPMHHIESNNPTFIVNLPISVFDSVMTVRRIQISNYSAQCFVNTYNL